MSEKKYENPREIDIAAFDYELPEERIAKFPLEERDASRLLLHQNGKINEGIFRDLPALLEPGTVLVFNNTRVIHARLHFHTEDGDEIEIFCLEPLIPAEYQQNFSAHQTVTWKTLIGNNRKWKNGLLQISVQTSEGSVVLQAERLGRLEDAFEVRFSWNAPLAFGEILHFAGVIPLPPYLNRQSTGLDEDRYQTVYAAQEGSVAAPTAGLHFTDRVLQALEQKGVQTLYLTLHVGVGTFKPVGSGPLANHHMHQEQWYIGKDTLQALTDALNQGKKIIAVGTTSMRVLESLYWAGIRYVADTSSFMPRQVTIDQWAPYQQNLPDLSPAGALEKLIKALEDSGHPTLEGHT